MITVIITIMIVGVVVVAYCIYDYGKVESMQTGCLNRPLLARDSSCL